VVLTFIPWCIKKCQIFNDVEELQNNRAREGVKVNKNKRLKNSFRLIEGRKSLTNERLLL